MFDRIARRYSLINTLTSFGCDASWRRRAVAMARVRASDRLLDVCCGPGDLADEFARHSPAPARIVGCDFSSRMIEEAQRRQSRRAKPIELVQGDAMHMPFGDASFDVVSCAFGVRNLADPSAGVAEFARVLAPGGRVVILEFAEPRGCVFGAMYRFYFRRVLPRLAWVLGGDRQAYEYLPRSVASFFSPEQLADILEAAGFVRIRRQPVTMGIATITVGQRR